MKHFKLPAAGLAALIFFVVNASAQNGPPKAPVHEVTDTYFGFKGTEHLLIDPEKLSSPGKRYSIDSYSPSFDGKYVCYTVSLRGSENGEMRVDAGHGFGSTNRRRNEQAADIYAFLFQQLGSK
jgi:protease II